MEATGIKKHPHKPLKMRLAKLFNKGKRTASVPEVCSTAETPVDTEMEALHISRTDNPYIQVLSSQDHLDQADSSVVMSPDSISPTRSYAGNLKEYSLSEIHSHLVRYVTTLVFDYLQKIRSEIILNTLTCFKYVSI